MLRTAAFEEAASDVVANFAELELRLTMAPPFGIDLPTRKVRSHTAYTFTLHNVIKPSTVSTPRIRFRTITPAALARYQHPFAAAPSRSRSDLPLVLLPFSC